MAEAAPPGSDGAEEPPGVRILAAAFAKDPSEGLLRLATRPHGDELTPVLAYWRRVGERYLHELCRVPESSEGPSRPCRPLGTTWPR